MTQSLSQGSLYNGNSQILDADTNRHTFVNPGSGALAADETTRLVGAMWNGATNDPNFWTLANNGTGSGSALAGSIISLTSGTVNNGYGDIVSIRHARFMFINPNRWRGILRLTSLSVANNTRRFGACDITAGNPPTLNNGFYFSVNPTGVVSICNKLSTGGEVALSSGFNGNLGSTYSVPDTNFHSYEIVYYVAGVWFFVDGQLLHYLPLANLPLNDDFQLHCFAQSVNSAGGTASGVLEILAMSILRHGKDVSRPTYKNLTANATTTLKIGAGTLHRIIINKASGNTNTVTIYDNTAASGAIIGTINNVLGSIASIEFGLDFQIGLTIVIATGTAGDLTFIYD